MVAVVVAVGGGTRLAHGVAVGDLAATSCYHDLTKYTSLSLGLQKSFIERIMKCLGSQTHINKGWVVGRKVKIRSL